MGTHDLINQKEATDSLAHRGTNPLRGCIGQVAATGRSDNRIQFGGCLHRAGFKRHRLTKLCNFEQPLSTRVALLLGRTRN